MHMSTYLNQNTEGDEADRGPTAALDVHIGERHMECIKPTDVDLRKGWIIVNAVGQGAKMKVVMRMLDSLGYIQGSCGFLTDTENMNRVRHHLEIADYIAEIKRIEDDASPKKKDENVTNMIDLVMKSENLLTKDGYTVGANIGEFTSSKAFTKGFISSILGWFTMIQYQMPSQRNNTSISLLKKYQVFVVLISSEHTQFLLLTMSRIAMAIKFPVAMTIQLPIEMSICPWQHK